MLKTYRHLPAIIGRTAQQHARLQIELGGTLDKGFQKWPERKIKLLRPQKTVLKKTKSGLKPSYTKLVPTNQFNLQNKKLLRVTGRLYNAITYQPDPDGRINVGVDLKTVPYAEIHNKGGKITITAKQRAFFMFKYKTTFNSFYLNLARTKGQHINIPKRQYLAITPELIKAINKAVYKRLITIK